MQLSMQMLWYLDERSSNVVVSAKSDGVAEVGRSVEL